MREPWKTWRLATAAMEMAQSNPGEKVVPNGWHPIGNKRHERGVGGKRRGKLMECW
jgi:hypothetical protein